MQQSVDALIVGGGPGGLFMAARLAERGLRTLVCEEHSRVGDPVHCTGVLAADTFPRFDLPHSATLNQLTTVRFQSPGGIHVDYMTPSPLATVIGRPSIARSPIAPLPPAPRCAPARGSPRSTSIAMASRPALATPSCVRASSSSPAARATRSSDGSDSACRAL